MSHTAPLTFVEEIVLLALDDTTGALRPMPVMGFNYALAGAVLADLALANRIDTDPNQLVVINPAPTGDPLLDPALAAIVAEPEKKPVAYWLSIFSEWRPKLERAALDRLVAHGILRRDEKKILWVFGVRRYPTIDNHERVEVRTRLTALILSEDLPDPRDAVLISLLTACQLSMKVFPEAEFNARAGRLANLAKMDLVGREVAAAIDHVTRALATAVPLGM